MSVEYKDLGLKINEDFTEIEINGKKIQIKKYLNIDKKSSIVNLAATGSVMNGYVHDILMDAYFHVLLVENYTDISFDENSPEDILNTFDELESTGVLSTIIDAFEPKEYNSLYEALEILKNNINEYNRSQAGALNTMQQLAELSNQTE